MTDLFDLAEDLPEPLNDVSIDCRGLPFMPLHTARLKDSEFLAISSGDEFKAGLMLWIKSWSEIPAGSLPDDDRILAKATGYSLAHFLRLKKVAMRGFILCSDGRLYHPAICDFAAAASRRRKNTAEAANTRWAAERKKKAGKSAKPTTPRNASADAPALTQQYKGEGEGEYKKESPLPPSSEKPVSPEKGGPSNMILADYFDDERSGASRIYRSDPERRRAEAWHMAKGVLELYGVSKAAAGKCVGEIMREYSLTDDDLAALALRVFDAKPKAARPFLIGCARQFAKERDSSALARGETKTTSSEDDRGFMRRELARMTDPDRGEYLWPRADLGAPPGQPGCRVDPDILIEFGFTPWTPPAASVGEFA